MNYVELAVHSIRSNTLALVLVLDGPPRNFHTHSNFPALPGTRAHHLNLILP